MIWRLPAVGRITSPFGPRVLAGAVSTHHDGVDLGAKRGPVYAAAAGRVRTIWQTAAGAWVVDLRHAAEGDRQIRTRYIHMFRDEILVAVGQRVTAGQQIGSSGASGTSAAHLHFEFLVNGVCIDPVPAMAARGVTLGVTTVTNPSADTGTAPVTPTLTPPAPIVPEEDIVATLEQLQKVVADAVAPLTRRGCVFRLDVPGAQAIYAEAGSTARLWLKTAADVKALAPGSTVPLPPDDAFWARTVVYAVGELYRRKGEATGAAWVLAGADVDGRRVPALRHVGAAEYAAWGWPLLVDVDPGHALWSLPVIGG